MSTLLYNISAIARDIEYASPVLVEVAARFQAAILTDVASRRGTLNCHIKPLVPTMKVAGSAVTVEVCPGDDPAVHAVLVVTEPDGVTVMGGRGGQSCTLIGGIMATQARATDIAGFVIDGVVRDSHRLANGTLPIFPASLNPCGPTKSVTGRMNLPVSTADAAVHPGDLMVSDADGVVVIPRAGVEHTLVLVQKRVDAETAHITAIRRGDTRPGWPRKELCAVGMLAEGEVL